MQQSTEKSFKNLIRRIRRFRFFYCLYHFVTTAVIAGALLWVIRAEIVLQTLGLTMIQKNHPLWWICIISLAVASFHIVIIVMNTRFHAYLVDVDRRLDFKDRISTAYELFFSHAAATPQKSPDNAGHVSDKPEKKEILFRQLLLEDIANHQSKIQFFSLYPPKITSKHWYLIGALIAAVCVHWYQWPVMEERISETNASSEVSDVLSKVQHYTNKRLESIDSTKDSSDHSALKRMKKLSKPMPKSTTSDDSLQQTVRQLLQEVASDQMTLVEEMKHALSDEENIELERIETQEQSPTRAFNIQNLIDALQDLLQDGASESLKELLDDLKESNSIRDDLEMIAAAMDARSDSTVPSSLLNNHTGKGDAGKNNRETDPKNSEHADIDNPQKPPADASAAKKLPQKQPKTSKNNASKQSAADTDQLNQEGVSMAGASKSDRTLQTPQPILQANGALLRDKIMTAGQTAQQSVPVRSITESGDAAAAEQTIRKQYKNENEQVMQKEDIPQQYRDYIKQYFLSIGL